ncbi:MAG: cytochrome PufQ [Pseudomonadota bacterium]
MISRRTQATDPGRRTETGKLEYAFYFSVIFLFSLPWAVVNWALDLVRSGDRVNRVGIYSRARSQARIITPLIFSA